jgi:hypothetical protein
MGFDRVFVDRSHRTCFLANQTLIAILADPALIEPQGRDQAEQGAQGTEITAPKPWSQAIKGNDSPKDQKGNGRHIIDRLRTVNVGEGDPSQSVKQGTEQIQS